MSVTVPVALLHSNLSRYILWSMLQSFFLFINFSPIGGFHKIAQILLGRHIHSLFKRRIKGAFRQVAAALMKIFKAEARRNVLLQQFSSILYTVVVQHRSKVIARAYVNCTRQVQRVRTRNSTQPYKRQVRVKIQLVAFN